MPRSASRPGAPACPGSEHRPLSRAATLAFGDGGVHFDSQQALSRRCAMPCVHRRPGALRILVKGSRSSAMDKVVDALLAIDTREAGHAA